MRNAVDMAVFVLNKYYRLSEAIPAYSAALLLDPSKRKQYMKQNWKSSSDMDQAIERVRSVWKERYKNLPVSKYNESQRPPQPPANDQHHKKGKKRQEASAYSSIRAEIRGTSHQDSEVDDEFQFFIDAAKVNLEARGMTPLEWWCLEEHRSQYPRLFKMALDILSIPPMSDAPERTFSCGRRTIAWSRAKLKSESIQMVETLSNWVSQGFISPNQGMRELLEAVCDVDIDLDSADE